MSKSDAQKATEALKSLADPSLSLRAYAHIHDLLGIVIGPVFPCEDKPASP